MSGRATMRPHLHISLQSGSDAVLERMRRPYRSDRARQAVAEAAAVDPDMGIGADLIVGFPGETEAEFGETERMVEELPFTYLHVFRYSPRPGTPAAELPAVHPEAVSERSQRLRELARCKREAFQRGLVGQRREAVVENPDDRDPRRRLATTDNYAPVSVRCELPAGTLIEVRIAGFSEGRLVAEDCTVLREVPA
jgi:threonylcarbamoyladenosine tRNA methylthiotransferase MtaB